jgi:DNA uptake protein ComE-like DNA-binding protein
VPGAAAGAAAGAAVGATTAPRPAAAQGQRVNINTATAAELDGLPQIGDARSRAIIEGRPYRSVEELLERRVIPSNAYEAIKDLVTVR